MQEASNKPWRVVCCVAGTFYAWSQEIDTGAWTLFTIPSDLSGTSVVAEYDAEFAFRAAGFAP
jgi:hypothetical protein